jgi:ribosomal-protein-alanine N-acetyltransferase
MAIQLETERLILKQFSEEDAEYLFELNSDPDVTKYVGEGAYKNIDDVRNFIRNYDQYEKYGQGRLNIFSKQTGEYIGWCGLKYLADKEYTDLGYRLLKRHWGKGYATEAAIVCLDYGFKVLNLDKIIGTAMKENTASIKVFEKLGLRYSHDDNCGEQPGVVYVITKEEWKQSVRTQIAE